MENSSKRKLALYLNLSNYVLVHLVLRCLKVTIYNFKFGLASQLYAK